MDVVKFNIGEEVYLKMDRDDPECGMVTGLLLRPTGWLYYVTWGKDKETLHYDIEITYEKPGVKV